jgi:hypothetical protein
VGCAVVFFVPSQYALCASVPFNLPESQLHPVQRGAGRSWKSGGAVAHTRCFVGSPKAGSRAPRENGEPSVRISRMGARSRQWAPSAPAASPAHSEKYRVETRTRRHCEPASSLRCREVRAASLVRCRAASVRIASADGRSWRPRALCGRAASVRIASADGRSWRPRAAHSKRPWQTAAQRRGREARWHLSQPRGALVWFAPSGHWQGRARACLSGAASEAMPRSARALA